MEIFRQRISDEFRYESIMAEKRLKNMSVEDKILREKAQQFLSYTTGIIHLKDSIF